MPRGEAAEKKQLNPAERVRMAREAWKTGKNLGRAFEYAGKLEYLAQYAEQHPEMAKDIVDTFEKFNAILEITSNVGDIKGDINAKRERDEWIVNEFEPWLEKTFRVIQERERERESEIKKTGKPPREFFVHD